jgi:hypothetical protein
MESNISLIIIGIYTLIYLIVFFIQKSQLNNQKEIINSMKTFMDIFDIEEVKRYVQMREERIKGDVENILSSDIKMTEISQKVTLEAIEDIQKFYINKTKDKVDELFGYCLVSLKQIPFEERELILKNHFVKTGGSLREGLKELEK